MAEHKSLEQRFEGTLFAARWLMAPMYVGLVALLVVLGIVFLRELIYYVPQAMDLTPDKIILVVLSLIDLTLVGNLILIVIFSGYENFVSKLNVASEDRPYWMGNVDFAGLKLKILGSIVAISAIHLLKRFMEIGKSPDAGQLSDTDLTWLIAIHLVFVVSGVVMALMDWLASLARK